MTSRDMTTTVPIWRTLRPVHTIVRGRQWSSIAGRAVSTHRRGWVALITKGKETRRCGHAHIKLGQAIACGERMARAVNAAERDDR